MGEFGILRREFRQKLGKEERTCGIEWARNAICKSRNSVEMRDIALD
jgi:hypothetical protein